MGADRESAGFLSMFPVLAGFCFHCGWHQEIGSEIREEK